MATIIYKIKSINSGLSKDSRMGSYFFSDPNLPLGLEGWSISVGVINYVLILEGYGCGLEKR